MTGCPRPPKKASSWSINPRCAASREIAGANTWKLPTLRTRSTTPLVSMRYTIVCTVVYAGLPLAGKVSWISRIDSSPFAQRASMMRNSSFDKRTSVNCHLLRLCVLVLQL